MDMKCSNKVMYTELNYILSICIYISLSEKIKPKASVFNRLNTSVHLRCFENLTAIKHVPHDG